MTPSSEALVSAAVGKQWAVAEWLLDCYQLKATRPALYLAATTGQVKIVAKMLQQQSPIDDMDNTLTESIGSGLPAKTDPEDEHSNFAIVKMLCESGAKCVEEKLPGNLVGCAENGQLETLQWLHARGVFLEVADGMVDYAAKKGHAAIVRWLLRHCKPSDRLSLLEAVATAVELGEQEVLEVLVDYIGSECLDWDVLISASSEDKTRQVGSTLVEWIYERMANKDDIDWEELRGEWSCVAVRRWARRQQPASS
ncbi:hypothetical protein ATCC90586_005089 [Pythium insidiosum]|nr:hypothetical protein ATCC90586_005089 [Pythium insidiosum]